MSEPLALSQEIRQAVFALLIFLVAVWFAASLYGVLSR